MAFTEDQINNLMDLLKIPTEKRNFEEFRNQIQNLIEEKDSLRAFYDSKNDNSLEKIFNSPGNTHNFFLCLFAIFSLSKRLKLLKKAVDSFKIFKYDKNTNM